jgi:hypothetical protein
MRIVRPPKAVSTSEGDNCRAAMPEPADHDRGQEGRAEQFGQQAPAEVAPVAHAGEDRTPSEISPTTR